LRRFYDETIGALDRYDREHGTVLVSTLETFFWHNANVSRAARALYVHRNTLNYRLQRIEEISGLMLSDPETRLAMQLDLKTHYILQASQECADEDDARATEKGRNL